MSNSLLSIVIPCFNRHDLITQCLDSVVSDARSMVQVVLVDDGSDPPLADVVSSYLRETDILIVQHNRGRGAALRSGLLAATGKFSMIMDSDDDFVEDSLNIICQDLERLDSELVGAVYGVVDHRTGSLSCALPEGQRCTLLSLRADHHVTGDLKEVILTPVVKRSLYPDPGHERRVPTSYIWAGVSRDGEVLVRDVGVINHRYLPDGMTDSIRALKASSPQFLVSTHVRIAAAPSNCYRSAIFRMRHCIQAYSVKGAVPTMAERADLVMSLGRTRVWVFHALGRIMAVGRRF